MSSSSSSDEDSYGPALPPHMLQKKNDEEKGTSAGVGAFIGPGLPPGLGFNSTSIMTQQEELDEQVDPMPRRPVTATSTTTTTAIGVTTDHYGDDQPAAFCSRKVNAVYDKVVGAAANEREDESSESDEEDICGPFPPEHPKANRSYGVDVLIKEPKPKPKREEWMLIPPKNKPMSNLTSRKFLPRSLETRNDEDDETNKEQDLKEELEAKLTSERDELMSNLQSESSKRTTESLLESHRKNLKKRKHEESSKSDEKKERRPFDRDNDLKVFGLNADDKKRFMDRTSAELKGRFSHGKKSGKFL